MVSVKGMILNFMSYARGDFYMKTAKIGLGDTQIIILTTTGVDSRGIIAEGYSVLDLPLCVMVVIVENIATDRSQGITCILTWNSTCRRCEKTGLLWFCWSIHARRKAFVYGWNSFLRLKEKTIVYWCWAEPIGTRFITQHSSTRLFLVSFTKSLEVPWLEINVCFFDMLYVWKCTLRSVLQTVQREYKLVQYSPFFLFFPIHSHIFIAFYQDCFQ